MFNDPYYGLNTIKNFAKWDPLVTGSDPLANRLFKNELKTYFGLTQAQVLRIEVNWNTLYSRDASFFRLFAVPASTIYPDQQMVAYWQWANATLTHAATPPTDSVIYASDTVTGYPEISFFHTNYFNTTVNQKFKK